LKNLSAGRSGEAWRASSARACIDLDVNQVEVLSEVVAPGIREFENGFL
jgi:hypothetical protein